MSNLNVNLESEYTALSSLLDAQWRCKTEEQIGRDLPVQYERLRAATDDIVADYDREETKARRFMTPEGYENEMGALRPRIRERLDRESLPLLAAMMKRIEGLSARVVTPPSKLADGTALKIERRGLFRGVDHLILRNLYLESCRVNDELTWAALEEAAIYDPCRLPADAIAEGRRIRAEIEHPNVIHALQATEALLAETQGLIRFVKRHCQLENDLVDLTRQEPEAA